MSKQPYRMEHGTREGAGLSANSCDDVPMSKTNGHDLEAAADAQARHGATVLRGAGRYWIECLCGWQSGDYRTAGAASLRWSDHMLLTTTVGQPWCDWCGRAIYQGTYLGESVWLAVKGEERGYEPLTCEASEDVRHEPAGGVA